MDSVFGVGGVAAYVFAGRVDCGAWPRKRINRLMFWACGLSQLCTTLKSTTSEDNQEADLL
jgi:hypothetical protein